MAEVVLDDVIKTFGSFVAVNGITLEVADGEFVTLLGGSGCGKTTSLRMVAGFIKPTTGVIRIGGNDVTALPPNKRDTGMVFQNYALFPHLTVFDNVAFGLVVRKTPKRELRKRVNEILEIVQLAHLAERYPAQLSGGQMQRVALARAVVIKPKVLLLDEPLGALDLKLRKELQIEIRRVQQALGITTLFVTHDQGEALSLSDRIVVMCDGEIFQIGSPDSVYERPNSEFVANFIGETNLLQVQVEKIDNHQARCKRVENNDDGRRFKVDFDQPPGWLQDGQDAMLGFRPEYVTLDSDAENKLSGVVQTGTYFGSNWLLSVAMESNDQMTAELRPGTPIPATGETVELGWSPKHSFLLPASPHDKGRGLGD